MAKRANSSNNSKSRWMLRLGCKRPAGTRTIGGASGTRAICLSPPNKTSNKNGDNKSKTLNITDTHHNNILYTSTITQTQISDQDYLTHDNKREHTTAIFTSDKSKQHNQPKPPKTTWRKRTRKRPNKKMNGNFIFDERTHFNELDQSTPFSENYKNSEICKHKVSHSSHNCHVAQKFPSPPSLKLHHTKSLSQLQKHLQCQP